eukprot:TRINITY_DN3735_c0_g1_i1.p1 TRINITY_DN3735_c0_g1~~TRINITY_DN3735_c0_g1_i1.p1  ORF type:complete len:898 (+),score=321.11 TRINITY_DN3735_c0_g1_i1:330-3023(+)
MAQNKREWRFSVPFTEKTEPTSPPQSLSTSILYYVRIEAGDETWSVRKKYGEFKRFHARLLEELGRLNVAFPYSSSKRPPKISLAEREEFVQLRRLQLSNYLQLLADVPEIVKSQTFSQFMDQETANKTMIYDHSTRRERRGKRNVVYWVEGMKLEAIQDNNPSRSDELAFCKGDILTYMGGRDEATERVKGAVKGKVGWVPVSAVDVYNSPGLKSPESPETAHRSRSNSIAKEPQSAPTSPALPHVLISRESPPSPLVMNSSPNSPAALLKNRMEPNRNKSDPASSPNIQDGLSPNSSPLIPATRVFNRFIRPRSNSSDNRVQSGEFMPVLTFTSDLEAISVIFDKEQDVKLEKTDALSEETLQRVASCKRFFREYYRMMAIEITQRKERQNEFEKQINVTPNEDKKKILTDAHRQRETNILREKRGKLSLEDFEIVDMIGKGGFGKVYLARDLKNKGNLVALKKIKKAVIMERNKLESLMTEREVLTILNQTESPWLIKLACSFQDRLHFYFAMEFASGGNLKNLLELRMLDENEAQFYICEMIAAVDTLHKLGFIHRDLKPDNFLFDGKGHVKLADFGLSKGGILKRIESNSSSRNGPVKFRSVRIYLKDGTFRTVALHEKPVREEFQDIDYDSEITPSPFVGNICHAMSKKLDLTKKDAMNWHLCEVKPNGEHRLMDSDEDVFKIPGMSHTSAANLFTIHDLKDTERHYLLFKEMGAREPRRNIQRNRASIMYASKLDLLGRRPSMVKLDANEINKRRDLARGTSHKKAMYSFVGSPYYMAPEIITRNGYDELVDWWSLGCILYEMIIGFPPFMGDTPNEVFMSIVDHENILVFPDEEPIDENGEMMELELEISDVCKDLIRRFLSSAEKGIGKKNGNLGCVQGFNKKVFIEC